MHMPIKGPEGSRYKDVSPEALKIIEKLYQDVVEQSRKLYADKATAAISTDPKVTTTAHAPVSPEPAPSPLPAARRPYAGGLGSPRYQRRWTSSFGM